MTFKHGKFSESVVMRSLEKVAREKGLVKEEDFVKTATVTKRANLNPSSDPLVSLMRLGEGLREAGYEKLAVEIEDKALAFKQAQTLYETSKETGEDLIDFAHPKGSHKLEGVDGTEAVFETILDQHLKSVKMIEKMPTGKLASHKDILGAVKKALAQGASTADLANEALGVINEVARLVNEELTVSVDNFTKKAAQLASNPTVFNIKELKTLLDRLSKRLNPSFFSGATWGMGGLSDYTWNRASSLINKAQGILNKALESRMKDDNGEQAKLEGRPSSDQPITLPEQTVVASKFDVQLATVENLKQKISTWKAYRSISNQPSAIKWINEEMAALNDITKRYSAIPEGQQEAAASQLSKEVGEEKSAISQFENSWIKGSNS